MKTLKITSTIIGFAAFLLTLISCKKDQTVQETPSDLISKLEIIKLQASTGFGNTVDLKYDDQNRLIGYGLEKFSYNAQGKVEKRSLTDENNKLIREYGYIWDTDGRLAEVRLYYYYQDNQQAATDIAKDKPVIAKFEYLENQRNPSELTWKTIVTGYAAGRITTTLSAEKTMKYYYKSDNLQNAIYSGSNDFFPSTGGLNNFEDIEAHIFYKPGDKAHFLNKLYNQLGFNPIELSDIITAKQPIQSITYVFNEKNVAVQPDWEKASSYELAYDNLSRPTLVSINQNIIGLSSIFPDFNKLTLIYKITY